jgi:hypothetical protein
MATMTKKFLSVGTDSITAEYMSDSFYAPSTSPVLNQAVNPDSTTTTVASSINPSSLGHTVTFTATVTSSTGAAPTGTVTFTAGTATLGTVALSGVHAKISTATLPEGATTITATYNGDTDYSSSSGSLTQTVNIVPTLVSIVVAPVDPSIGTGATIQFTAYGTYSDGSYKIITSSVAWSSSRTGVATIVSGGLATGVAVGTTTITAKSGTVSGSTALTVN